MLAISTLGLPAVVSALCILAGSASYLFGHKLTALAFALCLVAMAINTLIKLLFRRRRPDTLYVARMFFKSYSFPSGHTLGSMVFYGLLARLAWSNLVSPLGQIVAVMLVLFGLLVGVSRVYLGAHHPSDIVGAWFLSMLAILIIAGLTS